MYTGGPTVSGLSEIDYPNVNGLTGLDNIKQLCSLNKVPLPPEIMEHFGRILCKSCIDITLNIFNHILYQPENCYIKSDVVNFWYEIFSEKSF